MSRYRNELPQLRGGFFLTDGGIDTDLIFNHGIEIREFATHTLLSDAAGRWAIADYFRPYLALADEVGAGFILNGQTWKAHTWWAADLDSNGEELRWANEDSIAFVAQLRDEFAANEQPIVLNGIIGPRGDSYSPATEITAHQAEEYHAQQIGWLVATEVDMVTAATFGRAEEAVGIVRAAGAAELPIVVSFTVDTNGALPSGRPLAEAIQKVDEATSRAAAYFMVNCAHPDHFFHLLGDSAWARRIRGIRCNASRLGHTELDRRETLDDGDPVELATRYAELRERMPWLVVFGGCCGTDLRHVTEIARVLSG
ncbi:MAG: homocysteine S-methyltransferase [bacterium]|nr:homocysteine S-methyltransferase [bacterium]